MVIILSKKTPSEPVKLHITIGMKLVLSIFLGKEKIILGNYYWSVGIWSVDRKIKLIWACKLICDSQLEKDKIFNKKLDFECRKAKGSHDSTLKI